MAKVIDAFKSPCVEDLRQSVVVDVNLLALVFQASFNLLTQLALEAVSIGHGKL